MTNFAIHDDEAAVLLSAQTGDRKAFSALVNAYQRKAYAIAYGFVRNREDALEIAQDAFVKAYKAIDRFDTDRPFYPWLYRIIKNTCLNHIKRKKRRGETSLDRLMDAGFDVAATREDPSDHASLNELRAAAAAAIDALSAPHCEIITLRHIHDLSYAEISECLDIPKGTVMSRLHAARRAMRESIQEH